MEQMHIFVSINIFFILNFFSKYQFKHYVLINVLKYINPL